METVLTDEEKAGISVVSGFAHPQLAEDIATYMGVELDPLTQRVHPNGEVYGRHINSIRGKHVFIVQSHVNGVETNIDNAIRQQALLADGARSSSAREITAVSPYLAYTRQDRKDKAHAPIAIRNLIDHLAISGVHRIVTMDMHSKQAEAVFRGPFDHLTAQPTLRKAMWRQVHEVDGFNPEECMVVAPDYGAGKISARHRRELGTHFLVMDKARGIEDSQKITREEKTPEADGMVCLIFDDILDTAGTIVTAAEVLKNSGARKVYVAASHGTFSDPAFERLAGAPIDKLFVTDTFPMVEAKKELGDLLEVVTVAPKIGQALIEIATCGSVSKVFDDENHY